MGSRGGGIDGLIFLREPYPKLCSVGFFRKSDFLVSAAILLCLGDSVIREYEREVGSNLCSIVLGQV